MRNTVLMVGAALALGGRAGAQSLASAVTLIDSARVAAAFAKGTPLLETGAYKIHASRREGPGKVEVHTRDTDIFYVVAGEATFVTGGSPVDTQTIAPAEIRGARVEGGETRTLRPGDVIVIPRGTPHWFTTVRAPLLYFTVKVTEGGRP